MYFSCLPDEPQFQVSFEYSSKKFNFNRDLAESVKTCLERIKRHLDKFESKKDKEISERIQFSVQLLNIRKEILSEETFIDLFKNSENLALTLFINEEAFKVKVNVPFVNNISLPSTILAGYMVHTDQLTLQFTTIEECEFTWHRGSMNYFYETIWEEVGKGYFYIPSINDIDYSLKVTCTPKNEFYVGTATECISKNFITAGPRFCPFQKRHDFTKMKLEDKKFRVMSYNLLADYYSKTEISKKLFYPYCVPHALEIDYRKQLFMKEIIGYNSDIICLQEVDENIFELDLVPILGSKCLKGNFRKKGTTTEGLATFYDTRRFEIVEEAGIHIGSNIKTLKIFTKLWKKIQNNTKLVDRITERSTTLQVTALRSKDYSEKIIVVANTHLFFHPDADHIRLLQIGFSMLFIKDFIKKLEAKLPANQFDFIFCGDFNSLPNNGIYKLMTEKMVPDTCVDWKSSKFYYIGFVNGNKVRLSLAERRVMIITIGEEDRLDSDPRYCYNFIPDGAGRKLLAFQLIFVKGI